MGEEPTLNPGLRAAIREFRRASHIQRVIVFGSRATGGSTVDSDVDLLLVDPRFAGVKSFRRARGLHKHWVLEVPVDFLCYTPEEFEALRSRPTLVREAAEHGIVVEA